MGWEQRGHSDPIMIGNRRLGGFDGVECSGETLFCVGSGVDVESKNGEPSISLGEGMNPAREMSNDLQQQESSGPLARDASAADDAAAQGLGCVVVVRGINYDALVRQYNHF